MDFLVDSNAARFFRAVRIFTRCGFGIVYEEPDAENRHAVIVACVLSAMLVEKNGAWLAVNEKEGAYRSIVHDVSGSGSHVKKTYLR